MKTIHSNKWAIPALIIAIIIIAGGLFIFQGRTGRQGAQVFLPWLGSPIVVTPMQLPPGVIKCKLGATPTVTVTSPNGGEVYQEGQNLRVTWQTCNIPNPGAILLSFEYVPNNGQTLPSNATIATTTIIPAPATGYQDFFIPDNYTPPGYLNVGIPFGKHFIVKATLSGYIGNGPVATGSNGTFKIVAQDASDGLFTINAKP